MGVGLFRGERIKRRYNQNYFINLNILEKCFLHKGHLNLVPHHSGSTLISYNTEAYVCFPTITRKHSDLQNTGEKNTTVES